MTRPTAHERSVLAHLPADGSSISAKRLIDACGWSTPYLSKLIRTLEEKRLLKIDRTGKGDGGYSLISRAERAAMKGSK